MTRVAVLGATGQLGNDLVRVLEGEVGYQVFALSHQDIECANAESVEDTLAAIQPDIVVNCAAFVRVDECEDRPEEAFQVNALGALHVARASARIEAICVYISTDYVFDGAKREPYTEEDPPFPLSVYGASKLAGEYFVRTLCARHFVVRTSGLYGEAGSKSKRGNFVEAMITLAKAHQPIRVVDDQVVSPTYTMDFAPKIQELVRNEAYGLYHVTNSGACSWYEFAQKIFELTGLKPDLAPTTTTAFGAKARRPAYSVLAHKKLRQLGLNDVRPWPEALKAYLQGKGHLAS